MQANPELCPHLRPHLAGAPTAPTSVTISSGPLSGAFVLPAEPAYDTLAYRLVPIKPEGADGALLFGASWKDLTDAEISAGSFTIPDPVTVGGTSYAVPNGRYRLDMQASNNNGATAGGAQWTGLTACKRTQTRKRRGSE